MQIFFLLLFTRAYIPLDAKTIITGPKIALSFSEYVPVRSFPLFNSVTNRFNFTLNSQTIDLLGIVSDSSIFCIIPIIFTIFFTIWFHLLFYLLVKIFSIYNSVTRCNCLFSITKFWISKVFMIMTYGYYIRCALEINQFILIISVSEVYNFNTKDSIKLISFIFAVLSLIN